MLRRALWVAHHRLLAVLTGLFVVLWVALAIEPRHRDDWALENALVAVFVVVLIASYRRFTLSRVSYLTIFVFLCLHEVGAHYTYAEVPHDEWFKGLTGVTLNSVLGWERNNCDRVIHFSYGLLLAYPVALASPGAVVAMGITYAINRALQRDFAAPPPHRLRRPWRC